MPANDALKGLRVLSGTGRGAVRSVPRRVLHPLAALRRGTTPLPLLPPSTLSPLQIEQWSEKNTNDRAARVRTASRRSVQLPVPMPLNDATSTTTS